METRIPTPSEIQSVLDIYERGLAVSALQRALEIAPFSRWSGVSGFVLASRLAANAGAPRLSVRLSLRAWHTDPRHGEAQVQYGFQLSEKRGPLAFLLAARNWPASPDATPESQAELLALKADAASDLRDFAVADELLTRAEALAKKPWVHLQRARLLERQDRIEEALEVARSAGRMHPHPFYRPAVQVSASLLQTLDRDADAIQLLSEACAALESGPVAGQLYGLLAENDRWREAEAALERYVALSPLIEPILQRWVSSQRARVAYHLGKRTEAIRFASRLEDESHKRFALRLADVPEQPERVQLEVTFVRQHFKTCAPATLAALGRYWKLPGEHLKLAEAMCYDGTPAWQQREWAQQNGWLVREFRVTQESAVALLVKGLPFAISTVETTSAHMMAVIGFDRTRGTLLLRDPAQPYVLEAPCEEFLRRYRAFGPRGMIFLPAAEGERLTGLSLPEAEAFDFYHELCRDLAGHARDTAVQAVERMEHAFPDHELTWQARFDVAVYDGNNSEQARCLDRLLDSFPNNPARLLQRFNCMRSGPREERIQFLECACDRKDPDPVLLVELARALQGDARCLVRARQCVKRAGRTLAVDSNLISVLADMQWEAGQREEATELYRYAANVETFREHLYQTWFIACRQTRRTEAALAHLEDRFKRFGSRSEQPALTLAWAWREMEDPTRAREVLLEALRLRPSDGYLSLRAGSLLAGLGESEEADRLLKQAREKGVRENDWLRTAAEMAEARLDTSSALRYGRQLLTREPLALDAHGGVARALARLEGVDAAMAHLNDACARFPHHYGLHRIRVEWMRELGPESVEAAARDLLRIDPSDAWAFRERAVALCKLGRGDEALAAGRESVEIEPRNSYAFSVLGHVHISLRQLSEARTQLRKAVELSVDNGDAISALLDLSGTDAERREELGFVQKQLVDQVVQGDGLLAYMNLVRPVVEPQELLGQLRQALAERPDLWHAWSALASQLGHVGLLDEAWAVARKATERFPHLPRIWLDLATVCLWRNDTDQEIAAARRAFEVNPAWSPGAMALADALARREKITEAVEVFDRALSHSPNEPQLHAGRASLLWRNRDNAAAFQSIEQALRLAPGFEWAWNLLQTWSRDLGQAERAGNFARELTRERPGETAVWLTLARTLEGAATLPERIAAADKALSLNSRLVDAWDLKAELLTIAEMFEEAILLCNEGLRECHTEVHLLRGRLAWIEARRRRLPEAITMMRAVLAENASYVWGWHQLAAWLAEQNAFIDAIAAIEQVLRFRPHDAWLHRQIGYLRLKQQDTAGAKKAFIAVLNYSPTDGFAAETLFDLQLDSEDFQAAEATLRLMQTHQPGARTLANEALLNLRQGEIKSARKILEALCVSPDPDPWPVDGVAQAFRRKASTAKTVKVLKTALRNPACNPQVGATAVRLLQAKGRDVSATLLFFGLKTVEAQRRAVDPLILGLAEHNRGLLFRILFWRRREVMFHDVTAWGRAGYALMHFKRMRTVVDWQSDWRTRPDIEPWMLFNQCLALRHIGRCSEADEVARHVITTWSHRDGSQDLRLFLAIEAALAGAVAEADDHLKQVQQRKDVEYDRQLLILTRTLLDFLRTPPPDRSQQFRVSRYQLGQEFSAWKLLNCSRDIRRSFRRAGRVFSREGGGWMARLWFGWKLNWQWSFLPVTSLLLAIAVQPPVLLGLLIYGFRRNRR